MSVKNQLLVFFALVFIPWAVHATNLVEAYQQALQSDPIYQEVIATTYATKAGLPISIAALLPHLTGQVLPSVTKTDTRSSDQFFNSGSVTSRYNRLTLALSQVVFDFAQFTNVGKALAASKEASAVMNAALQDLMVRVADAYFAVLRDEEYLSYSRASKEAYAKALDQAKQQFSVGVKTITDVYIAQASYDSSVAYVIAAEKTVADDRENLRVITGHYYPHLSHLSEDFPLAVPEPRDMSAWVQTSLQQNWAIQASRYGVKQALYNVRIQFSGHLPIVELTGALDRIYQRDLARPTVDQQVIPAGTTITRDKMIGLNITIPIFEGGGVLAKTNQASYEYEASKQRLEEVTRRVLNNARQSYTGVVSAISQIKADRATIKSTISSLTGMEEGYHVGTQTLVDLLHQREKVFEAQTAYANDRFELVTNIFALKQAAGTLGFDDLRAVNAWLRK